MTRRDAAPVAATFTIALFFSAFRAYAGRVPALDLRHVYGFVAVALVAAAVVLSRRAGSSRWLPWALAVDVLAELTVPVVFDRVPETVNRAEHFSALFLFTTLLALAARATIGREPRGPIALVVGLVAVAAGFANEGVEYLNRVGTPFFSPDTVLDLTTNLVAVVAATAFTLWPRAHTSP